MERIKQAIENAKNPVENRADRPAVSNDHNKFTKPSNAYQEKNHARWNIVKYLSAALLIFFGGWLWLRLDFMNQLELVASEYINEGVKQARAEIKRRLTYDDKFKKLIQANLSHCQAVAERDRDSYIKLVQKEVRVKNKKATPDNQEQFFIPNSALAEANRMLESTKAECKMIYETQLKNGG